MLINLGRIFDRGENEKTVVAQFDFSDRDFGDSVRFPGPVEARLSLRRHNGKIFMSLTANAVGQCVCARCLDCFEREFSFRQDFVIDGSFKDQREGEIPLSQNGNLDFDRLVYREVSLGLPSVILCEEDCPGLCPVCGKPLREGCRCRRERPPDPRLADLKTLLNNDE